MKPKRANPKILSVSRRTDIPAFYSDWFINRIKAGFVLAKGHIENKTTKKISLKAEDILCFIFWTKNPEPMMDKLHLLDEQGYKYYFQFTLTPYGQDIESFLPPKEKIVKTFIELSKKIGREKVIWRYDPILLNDKIDIAYHKKYFSELIKKLHPYTNKCIISFIDTPKSKENKEKLNLKKITKELMREITKEFHHINEKYKIKIATCSENIDLTNFEIRPGKCIDDKLIGNIIGHELSIDKDSSQRKTCGCVKSEDIGTYETCTHGCLFCYATKNTVQARLNNHHHDKNSPLLIEKI